MTTFATRRRRRRRIAVAVGAVVLLAVLAIVTALWRQSVRQTHVAEAQKLLALGQVELEGFPTVALAWARASLGVADTPEGRLFALKAIAKGPIARTLEFDEMTEGVAHNSVFSPDGEWVTFKGYGKLKVRHRSNGSTVVVDNFSTSGFQIFSPFFDTSGTKLGAWKFNREDRTADIRTYEVPGFSKAGRSNDSLGKNPFDIRTTNRGLFRLGPFEKHVEIWRYPFGGEWELFDRIDRFDPDLYFFDPRGKWLAGLHGTDVYLYSLERAGAAAKRIGRLDAQARHIRVSPDFQWMATAEAKSTSISVWPLESETPVTRRTLDTRGIGNTSHNRFVIDDQGRRIVVAGKVDDGPGALVWDMRSPAGADPLVLRARSLEYVNGVSFEPTGRWAVTSHVTFAYFWPLPEIAPAVFPGEGSTIYDLSFSADGSKVIVPALGNGVRILPVTGEVSERRLSKAPGPVISAALDRSGRFAAVTGLGGTVLILPLDGSEPLRLKGFDRSTIVAAASFHPDGDLVAAAPHRGPPDQKVIRVWNLRDDSVQVLGPTDDAGHEFDGGYRGLRFLPDGRLLSAGMGGVRRWRLKDGSSELLFSEKVLTVDVSPDGNTAAVAMVYQDEGFGPVALIDLGSGNVRQLEEYGVSNTNAVFGPRSDLFATAGSDGTIQVGRVSGGQPHIIFGHTAKVNGLTFSPDGRWLATGDIEGTVRLLPVPDLSKPAPHTLPHRQFLEKLDTFTNVRVVRDDASTTGWRVEVGPFPGWAGTPEW